MLKQLFQWKVPPHLTDIFLFDRQERRVFSSWILWEATKHHQSNELKENKTETVRSKHKLKMLNQTSSELISGGQLPVTIIAIAACSIFISVKIRCRIAATVASSTTIEVENTFKLTQMDWLLVWPETQGQWIKVKLYPPCTHLYVWFITFVKHTPSTWQIFSKQSLHTHVTFLPSIWTETSKLSTQQSSTEAMRGLHYD